MLFVGRFSFLNVLIEFFLLASRGPFARQVNNVAKVAVEFIGSVFGGARGDDCTLFQLSFLNRMKNFVSVRIQAVESIQTLSSLDELKRSNRFGNAFSSTSKPTEQTKIASKKCSS